MNSKHVEEYKETHCIRVPRVYDWIVSQTNFPVQNFSGASGLERLNFTCHKISEQVQGGRLTAEGILTDEGGNPLNPSVPGSILCAEVVQLNGRKNRNVLLHTGETVTLQEVIIIKKGFFVVEISNSGGDSCISSPQPFSVCEKVLLCAPKGTFLECEITNFDCDVCYRCQPDAAGNPAFQQVDVSINLSQNIQIKNIETVEIEAFFVNHSLK